MGTMEQERAPLEVGDRLRGDAIGDWHRATHGGQVLTLRILRADLAGQDHARHLFEEEVRRIGRLDHPGLLRILRVSHKPPRPWMLSAPIDTTTLEEAAAADGPLTAADALALVERLHAAFVYLQARKQVHAFPIPGRVIRVGEDWRLLTFRDIRAWDELKSLKGKKHPAPAFAPPEHDGAHLEPLRPLPYNSWSLGALLRFAAGGGAPRAADGSAAPLPESFPAELRGMVTRLCAEDPEARPQGERALAALLSGADTAAAEAPARKVIPAPVPRRKRRR